MIPSVLRAAVRRRPARLSEKLSHFKHRPRNGAVQAVAATYVPSSNLANEFLKAHSAIVVTRQLETLNLLVGFEQQNRYEITNTSGTEVIGYLVEIGGNFLTRQLLRTHRPFQAAVLHPVTGAPILFIRRPFYFISSRLQAFERAQATSNDDRVELNDKEDKLLAEVHQEWAPLRRIYNLFPADEYQFGRIDNRMFDWRFVVRDRQGNEIGAVDRKWAGIGREIFTDTGHYLVDFGAARSIEEKASILGAAVSIDFDYFSRTSGGIMPWFSFWSVMGGDDD